MFIWVITKKKLHVKLGHVGGSVFFFNHCLGRRKVAQHRVHRTSAGAAHTCGIQPPTADSASAGFFRQVSPLQVTLVVSPDLIPNSASRFASFVSEGLPGVCHPPFQKHKTLGYSDRWLRLLIHPRVSNPFAF